MTQQQNPILKTAYQRLLADKALEPDSPAYEPIYEDSGMEDPVAKLKRHISWSGEAESIQMFSGFRGTGKTTELYRLKKELEKDDYLVLYADALEYLNPSEEIDIVTMLLSIAGAFGEQLEKVGISRMNESYWKRFTNYLQNTTIEAEGLTIKADASSPVEKLLGGVKGSLDMKAALRTTPSFRQKLHSFLEGRLHELKRELNAFIEEAVKATRDAKGESLQIVFIFDQFEQLRGSRTNEMEVIHSVENLFKNHFPQLELPYVHAVYTVPPWLRFVLNGNSIEDNIHTLPCLRLWSHHDKERTPDEHGLQVLRHAISKRIGSEIIDRIFAPEDGKSNLIDLLIQMSGGHFRDLIRLFREVVTLVTSDASLPVNSTIVRKAIQNIRNQYLPIADNDKEWLRKIADLKDLCMPDDSPETVGRISRFLDSHHVLYLKNGDDWYDIHPLIREELGV
jgi:hypothetical protein